MGPERSLVGRVKCYVSDSQQIHGGPGEGPGMQAEVVLSEERSSREHGQHVVEPGPDTSEVKLPLRIQVPKRISQAQLQVGVPRKVGQPGVWKSGALMEVWEPVELATEPWEDREDEDFKLEDLDRDILDTGDTSLDWAP